MSQADTSTGTESDVDPIGAETELPRSFLVHACGPVTKAASVTDNVTECDETTIQISQRIETLEDFDTFYGIRDRRGWKRTVIQHLLETEGEDHVDYGFNPDEWEVFVDGRVEAYRGVIDVLANSELDVGAETPSKTKYADVSRELADLHVDLVHTEVKSEDDAFARLVKDCHREDLFGNGATIALLDAKHGQHEALEDYVKRFLEKLNDGGEN